MTNALPNRFLIVLLIALAVSCAAVRVAHASNPMECSIVGIPLNSCFPVVLADTLTADPNPITQGNSTTLTWGSTGADGCTGSGFSTGGAPAGSVAVSPSVTTTYQVSCSSGWPLGYTDIPASVTVTVNAAYADVYAGGSSPSSATAGTPVTLSATITNQGNAAASNFPNVFQISGVGYIAAQTLTLGVGGSSGITASYTFPAAGSYQVRACADTNTGGSGSVTESDESNNCASSWTTVSVTAAPAPDFTVSGGVTPTTATAGTPATLYSTLVNSGNAVAGVSSSHLFWIYQNGSALAAPSYTSAALGIGASVTASASYTFGSAGTYNVIFCADQGGQVTESNEGNNCGPWTNVVVSAPAVQCANGIDDDSDTRVDMADAGCSSGGDNNEGDEPAIVSFTATPSTVRLGDTSLIKWNSANTTSCTGSGFATGGATTNLTGVSVTPAAPATGYSINCNGAIGNLSVTVTSPQAYITADQTLVTGSPAGSTSLKWSASDVSTCTITDSFGNTTLGATAPGAGTTTTAATGITKQTRYTLSCIPSVGSNVTSSVLVNVRPNFNEF